VNIYEHRGEGIYACVGARQGVPKKTAPLLETQPCNAATKVCVCTRTPPLGAPIPPQPTTVRVWSLLGLRGWVGVCAIVCKFACNERVCLALSSSECSCNAHKHKTATPPRNPRTFYFKASHQLTLTKTAFLLNSIAHYGVDPSLPGEGLGGTRCAVLLGGGGLSAPDEWPILTMINSLNCRF
jgi:hypothetical protein